jgi:hypothetical protein
MTVVFWKELGDHFSSLRFIILMAIIVLLGVWAIYASGQSIRQEAEKTSTAFAFLLLLTSQSGGLFSLATFLGLLGPLVGIMLGFDAISGEYARGTLSRVLSQPIYRDSLINGKFLAGLATVATLWASILLLVIGLGIAIVGFPPNTEELWRMLIYTVVGIIYVGFWLALAMLFSLLFQRTVTAANRDCGFRLAGGLAIPRAVRAADRRGCSKLHRSQPYHTGGASPSSGSRRHDRTHITHYFVPRIGSHCAEPDSTGSRGRSGRTNAGNPADAVGARTKPSSHFASIRHFDSSRGRLLRHLLHQIHAHRDPRLISNFRFEPPAVNPARCGIRLP